VSAKSWVIVALAVAALCILIGIAVTTSLDFVLIALVAMAAMVVTYIVGRRDDQRSDQRGDG
jgi:Flp pilus assembly protein TadB